MHSRVQASLDTAFYSAHIRLGRPQIVLMRKQECNVHWNSLKDNFLDCVKTLVSPRYFYEQVVSVCPGVESLRRLNRPAGIVSEKGRNLYRNPTVHSVRRFMNRGKKVCGSR